LDPLAFFGLEETADPRRWRLPVVPELCSGIGALFGGAGLGACIEALEHTTGRPLVWATAQYLSYARPPALVEIAVTGLVRGHHSSQARAVATVEGEEIFTVNAALGRRPAPWRGQWAERIAVPAPDDSPPREDIQRYRGTLMDRIEMRIAKARPPDELPGTRGDGRSALWVRLPELDMSAATLAIVGDFVPFGVREALGQLVGGNSLDNTLRVMHHHHATEWILADVRVHAVADGFGHGLVHLWADDGTLLATASQSSIVREWRD
jgi:acyl-CoA thioesterase-2